MMFYIPSEGDIKNLKVGDKAPTCFGTWAKVVEITCQEDDVNGTPFVCYYSEFGTNGSRISHSLKAGELDRTVELSSHYKSLELDDIEKEMRRREISCMLVKEYVEVFKEGWHTPCDNKFAY